MATPPPPAPGAEIDTFTITNAVVDNNGEAKVEVDDFANKDNANDVTIVNTSTDTLSLLTIEKFGGNDDEQDVIRIDLVQFADDFTLEIKDAGDTVEDFVFLQGVHEFFDNGDGTFTATYFGSDSNLHTVQILATNATISPYYTPDGIITGAEGAEVMGDGYTDIQGDEIGAGDGQINDEIIGGGGRDTINAGSGDDTIYGDYAQLPGGFSTQLPPDTFSGAPAGPAPGAEIDTYTINNARIDNNGKVKVEVDNFADKDNANDVTIAHGGTEAILEIEISKVGNGSEADVFRFDLSTYNDDFSVILKEEGPNDTLLFEDVHTVSDNGDGTYEITYFGSDAVLHTITVDPDSGQVAFHLAPSSPYFFEDEIDGGAGDDLIFAGFGDDVVDGGDGADTIDGGVGSDTIDGGTGADEIDGGDGADSISGGAGTDTIDGGQGDDYIDAGTEADSVDGGLGDDTILGGDGADTLYGGDGEASVPLERVAFQWSDLPDPDNGGQIDNLDGLVSGSQTVGGTTVDFTMTGGGGQFETTTTHTGGIDAGTGSVNANSAFGFDNADGVLTMNFSTPVENLQFNVSDFEANLETLKVQIYDDQGNLIPFSIVQGANISGSDTDAVSGNDTFESSSSEVGDASPLASIGITAAGPVGSIVLTYTETGGSLTMTDVWFDDPATGISGGGDDSIDGGTGDDLFIAGTGDDTISGGTGSDTYDANTATDLADETINVTVDNSGDGTAVKANEGTTDDLSSIEAFFAGEAAGGDDTITLTEGVRQAEVTDISDDAIGTFIPFYGTSGPIAFGGPGQPTINQLLSDTYTDPTFGRIRPFGDYEVSSGEEDGASVGAITFSNFEAINFEVVCFARGTRILTPGGEVEIETLRAGDAVVTMDAGVQPIRWIGSTTVPARGNTAPIEFAPGALGNTRRLRVSPQHRMLLQGWRLELLFGEDQALVTAKSLINDTTIRRVEGGTVEYFHMLFDTHQIVFAEGAPSESFHPGAVGMDTLAEATRAEIYDLFPELNANLDSYGAAARCSLKSYEGRALVAG